MLLDNKNSGYVGTELKAQAYEGSKLSVLSALFTLYGFSSLKKEFPNVIFSNYCDILEITATMAVLLRNGDRPREGYAGIMQNIQFS